MMSLSPLLDAGVADSIRQTIDAAHRVAIVCHISPDGDALGSSLAMMHLMHRLGKSASVITPDVPPESLSFMPGFDSILPYTTQPDRVRAAIGDCGLLLCLDFNSLKRVDKLAPVIERCPAPRIMIDHHEQPDLPVDIGVSVPSESSTCVLLYQVLHQIGATAVIDRTIAECLMTGILTDTGGLAYNSLAPSLYMVVAELVARGVDKDLLYRRLFRTSSEDRIRLTSFALLERMTMYPQHRAAVITLSADELRRFGYEKGMTEGLVNVPLEIPQVTYSVFMREDRERQLVKVSMRSKGDFPVDRFCAECFGGGGHLNAAGGELCGTLADALRRVEEAMGSYDCFLASE